MISRRDAPTYYVKIVPPGGQAQAVDLTERVVAFTFDDEESKADKLELDLDNFDLALFDDPHWRHGNTLIVSWGYVGNMSKPRKMVIGKITGSKMLKIEALAPSILMNKDVKSRTFHGMTATQVVAQIAKENGLEVATALQTQATNFLKLTAAQQAEAYGKAGTVKDAGDARDIQTISQAKMSDAQFVAHLAKRDGLIFHVKDNGLYFGARNMRAAPTRQFHYYADPGQGDVLDFNVENDVTMAPGGIVAKGRDPLRREDIHAPASNTETKRDGLGPITHTISKRDLTFTTQTAPIAQDAVLLTTAPTTAIAKKQVDAKYVRAQQATVQLTLSVIGDPAVGATQVIEVLGISKRLSGKYYVKSAKHKLSATAYVLDLTCHSDGSHASPATVGPRSNAAQNTAPLEPIGKLKPTTVFVDGRTLTTFRK